MEALGELRLVKEKLEIQKWGRNLFVAYVHKASKP